MRLTVAFVLVGAVLVGCNAGPQVVGKWTGNFPVQGTSVPASMDVKADKTYSMTMGSQGVTIVVTGTWELKDKSWTTTVTDAKIDGQLPAQAAMYKDMIDGQLAAMKGQQSTSTVEFPDAQTMKMTGNGQTATVTRVK